MKRITVLMVEDNRTVRRTFRELLNLETDIEVVGEAKDGLQAVHMVKKLDPDIVLMDVAMPKLNGLQATRQILEIAPSTKVLMLSTHNDDVYVEEAQNSGASGYLIKQSANGDVGHAIREVQKGNGFFSPSIPKSLRKRTGKRTD